jgi:hypothetical protein
MIKHIVNIMTILLLLTSGGFAAPAQKSNICYLHGEVLKIEKRVVKRLQPKSWINSWGLENNQVYIDVTIKINDFKHDTSGFSNACRENLQNQVFQITKENRQLIKVGDFLEAKAKFSGDEFSIGTWLYDINLK